MNENTLQEEIKKGEALAVFQSVLEKDPNNILALNDKGVALNSLGRYGEAIKMFLDVLQKDQNNSNAVFNLISNYFAVAEWNKAHDIFLKYGHCLSQTDTEMIQKDLERNIPTIKSKEIPIVCSICKPSELRKSDDERIEVPDAAVQHMLNHHKIGRFEDFLTKIKSSAYPEPPSEPHLSITKKMMDTLFSKISLTFNAKVLDVGCGQGPALDLFKQKGFSPIGITLNSKDLSACRQKGHEVYEMDQSFLDFKDQEFDLIWCRHCIEHSIFPYFTLSEFFRVLKPNGYLYIEVPAPDTDCRHQTNNNHYSVLGKSMWTELIKRAGFKIFDIIDIRFEVPAGNDLYWAFWLQKV